MLNRFAQVVEAQEKQAAVTGCDICGDTMCLLLVSQDNKRRLCLPHFREKYPSLYAGLARYCQEHPAEVRQ